MSSGGLAGLPLGLLWLRARDRLMEFEVHPHSCSGQAQHIHPAGSWWTLAAGSQEPRWAAGLAQLCTSPAQACSAWLCLPPWDVPCL